MKGFFKVISILLVTLSLVLLASCGKEDNDDHKNHDHSGGIIDPDGGVSGPIIPWD